MLSMVERVELLEHRARPELMVRVGQTAPREHREHREHREQMEPLVPVALLGQFRPILSPVRLN